MSCQRDVNYVPVNDISRPLLIITLQFVPSSGQTKCEIQTDRMF